MIVEGAMCPRFFARAAAVLAMTTAGCKSTGLFGSESKERGGGESDSGAGASDRRRSWRVSLMTSGHLAEETGAAELGVEEGGWGWVEAGLNRLTRRDVDGESVGRKWECEGWEQLSHRVQEAQWRAAKGRARGRLVAEEVGSGGRLAGGGWGEMGSDSWGV